MATIEEVLDSWAWLLLVFTLNLIGAISSALSGASGWAAWSGFFTAYFLARMVEKAAE